MITQQISKWISLVILVVGTILLIYMITYEDEPGALPLFLVLVGLVWYSYIRFQSRKQHRQP